MDISVIIPTLNRDFCLKNTLHDLSQQRGFFSFEIIVVDQNSVPVRDRDADLYTLSSKPFIRWIECVGKGVVYARNKGISVASGEILVFVDDDVKIDDNEFLSKHLGSHAEDDNVAAICGREINTGRPLLVDQLNYERLNPMSDILHFPRNFSKRIQAVILSTANCSIKKRALVKVKCFDESFSGASYGDDADLALRLAGAGYQIVYDPSPTLLHLMAPMGGLRLSDRRNSFSDVQRVISSTVFYLKHIRKEYTEFRLFYIYRYILRKSILLKANLRRPWRLPLVVWSLIRAFFLARETLKQGHKFSFNYEAS